MLSFHEEDADEDAHLETLFLGGYHSLYARTGKPVAVTCEPKIIARQPPTTTVGATLLYVWYYSTTGYYIFDFTLPAPRSIA